LSGGRIDPIENLTKLERGPGTVAEPRTVELRDQTALKRHDTRGSIFVLLLLLVLLLLPLNGCSPVLSDLRILIVTDEFRLLFLNRTGTTLADDRLNGEIIMLLEISRTRTCNKSVRTPC
jgi:hypothetical protein